MLFLYVDPSFWPISFYFTLKNFFSPSWMAGLMVRNYLNYLVEKCGWRLPSWARAQTRTWLFTRRGAQRPPSGNQPAACQLTALNKLVKAKDVWAAAWMNFENISEWKKRVTQDCVLCDCILSVSQEPARVARTGVSGWLLTGGNVLKPVLTMVSRLSEYTKSHWIVHLTCVNCISLKPLAKNSPA